MTRFTVNGLPYPSFPDALATAKQEANRQHVTVTIRAHQRNGEVAFEQPVHPDGYVEPLVSDDY